MNIVSDTEIEEIKRILRKRTDALIAQGPEACKEYLIKLGVLDENGKLKTFDD